MTVLQERTTVPSVEQFSDIATIVWSTVGTFTSKPNSARIISTPSTRLVTQEVIPPMTAKAINIIGRLLSFHALQDNWDDNGGVPPSQELINYALNSIISIDFRSLPFYFVAPGPNGEILVEFKLGDKMAEVYFEDIGLVELILYAGTKQVYVGEFQPNLLISHFDLKS